MKYTKTFFVLLVLVLCVFGCKKLLDPPFTLNEQQQAVYDDFMDSFASAVKNRSYTPQEIADTINDQNNQCAPFGLKIKDTKSGIVIAQGER